MIEDEIRLVVSPDDGLISDVFLPFLDCFLNFGYRVEQEHARALLIESRDDIFNLVERAINDRLVFPGYPA